MADFLYKLFGLASILIVLSIFGGIAGFSWYANEISKENMLEEPLLFKVEKGSSVRGIADNLKAQGVLENPFFVSVGARVLGIEDQFKAGEYQIQPEMSINDIMQIMAAGDIYQRQFTIPEGLTSYQITKRLNAIEELEGELDQIPNEGALLPETYNFEKGESRRNIVLRMNKAMGELVSELWENRAENLPLENINEAIILASIVEKETGKPGEYAAVAGVFINRLRIGMPLQADPTVIYAMNGGRHEDEGQGPIGRRLLRKDLQTDSPYNTYKNAGLPPGPIANPGRGALEGTLNPEPHTYLYFVADGTGGHVFATTLAEHNRNVAQWRKIRAAQ